MKKLLTLLFFVGFAYQIYGQTTALFEGQIHYTFQYEDRTGAMSAAQTAQFMGTEQLYTIKGNRYRSEMNGQLNIIQVYPGNDTIYNLMKGVGALLYIDARIPSDSVLSYKIVKTDDVIAGFSCNLLEITSKEGNLQVWYSDQVRIDPIHFKEHEFGLWNKQMELAHGALPLKFISETKKFRISMTAQKIIPMEIDNSLFILPKGLPLVPSPK